MTKKTDAKELQKHLTWEFPNIGKEAPGQREKADKYCRDYKEFLNKGKTERGVCEGGREDAQKGRLPPL